jgi:hypothetical protein
MKYPKFEQNIVSKIDEKNFQQTKSRIGVVMSYDKRSNTAVLVLEDRMSGAIGDIVKDVPCPDVHRNSNSIPNSRNTMHNRV